MRKEALSRDGYIIDQRETFDAPFGCRTSDVNGCGWIACYNLLRALGRETDPEGIRNALSRRSLFRGRLGASPFKVRRLLIRRGVPLKTRLFAGPVEKLSRTAEAGVLLYRHRGGWHYAAFAREGQTDGFRFFNAASGAERQVMTMDAFLKTAPVSRLLMAFLSPSQERRG